MESRVTFFIEEHPENLGAKDRVSRLREILTPEACRFLNKKGWGISLAMISLDEGTARLLRELNEQYPLIATKAWVVLDEKDGYFTTKFNVRQTRMRVAEIRAWAKKYGVRIDAFGFDLEPHMNIVKALAVMDVPKIAKGLWSVWKLRALQGQDDYSPEEDIYELIDDLWAEGVATESYEMPAPLGWSVFGVLQTKNFGRRATMVYSSAFPFLGKFVARLLKPATYPAVGIFSSTGKNPGRDLGGSPRLNGRTELQRDLKSLPRKSLKQLWIFALTDIQVIRWVEEALNEL